MPHPTRRLAIAVHAIVMVLGAACAKPWMVPSDKPITLAPNEGLVAFAVDAKGPVSLALCRDADLARCVELGPATTADGVVVTRVQHGRHCIMQIALEQSDAGFVETKEPYASQCIEVAAGRISYPGHFVVERQNLGNTAFFRWNTRWQDRSAVIRTLIDSAYPHLANVALRRTSLVPFAVPDD